ncbi:response regulator [Clostridium sp. NSJ-6]|uniref:Stage 0 sporulation protein A homolog n=1 Tax=Clostridium hominis TaxID=2763036 RepID=A0ABR7D962_9CLOT|nr:helix-turn-helix domain-containing protein [Clostridium hominis]MBC5627919.1 response regulator [Clostridium hominis]
MKIVVVDDDKIIRLGLTKIIKRLFEQHEVISDFQNGLVALEYLRDNRVDLVITDIKMPIMPGNELIEKSVNELDNPPIFVVLSGYDEFNYVRDTMKSGAFNYLLKPIKQEELRKVIEEVEIKIKENRKQDKLLSKSIEVLKKDFFKHILFSNVETNYKTDKSLLENIQLNENYIYKMTIVQRDNNNDKIIISSFIKNILDLNNGVEYLSFYFEGNVYIVFYLENNKESLINNLTEDIVCKADSLIENDKNVFIIESTDKVWQLREQSRLFRKLKNNICSGGKVKKYILNLSEESNDSIYDDNEKTNVTAIKLAKQYIINNFNKNITLKEVADEVFLSQNYLSELFKKEMGEGFYDFLSRYRIKVAKDLLLTTNLRVYEIAENVGYNDSITFGRAFKKITGATPNSFRNNKVGE